ncbi:hypothetical protein LJC53_06975, partial [Bacteroidales bacterium OttesenSCG-928-C03]|nr:hypothetical protein [Bacteroidales bacterium OttesenSCG-928-C03]
MKTTFTKSIFIALLVALCVGNLSAQSDYAECYIGDFSNNSYYSYDINTDERTYVSPVYHTGVPPTGEDFDGNDIYRIYAEGTVRTILPNGTPIDKGRISGCLGVSGLAYNWVADNGEWFFTDIRYVDGAPYMSLYKLNMTTLTKTLVGTFSTSFVSLGLAMDNHGDLYTLNRTDSKLMRINAATGETTVVGWNTFENEKIYSESLYADLAFDRGRNVLMVTFEYSHFINGEMSLRRMLGTLDRNDGYFGILRDISGSDSYATLVITREKLNPNDDHYVTGPATMTNLFPITTMAKYSYTQQIYDGSEIGLLDGVGVIKAVSFQYLHQVSHSRTDFKLYLGHTELESFQSTDYQIPLSELQLVYSGALPLTRAGDNSWVTILLDTEFNYTGGNLVVAVADNEGSNLNTLDENTFLAHTATDYKSLLTINDAAPVNPFFPATARSRLRSNIKFNISPICSDYVAGTGANGTANIPISTSSKHSYTQEIIDADVLNFPDDCGTIREVSFQYFNSTSIDLNNFSIYLANTTKSSFTSNNDWIPLDQLQLVYSGNAHFDNTDDNHWVTIPLDTNFGYTGDNLAIAILNNDGTAPSNGNAFYTQITSGYKTLYGVSSTLINPAAPSVIAYTMNQRNNFKFQICESIHWPVQNLTLNQEGCAIEFSWEEPQTFNALSYDIYCNNEKVGSTTDLSYTHTVSEDGMYYCSVVAVYNVGNSPKKSAEILIRCYEEDCGGFIVGAGTYETGNIPFNTNWEHNYIQQIFNASELGLSLNYGVIKTVS